MLAVTDDGGGSNDDGGGSNDDGGGSGSGTQGANALDISDAVTTDQLTCMKNSGIGLILPRVYESIGQADPVGIANAVAAINVGLAVHPYVFPCVACALNGGLNGTQQMDQALWFTVGGGFVPWSQPGQGWVWFDVEQPPAWSDDCNWNGAFLDAFIGEAWRHGVNTGVYASEYMWEGIMCASRTGYRPGASVAHLAHPSIRPADGGLPPVLLWYADWDGQPNFNDGAGWFGIWTQQGPAMKQFAADQNVCGVDTDLNWTPI